MLAAPLLLSVLWQLLTPSNTSQGPVGDVLELGRCTFSIFSEVPGGKSLAAANQYVMFLLKLNYDEEMEATLDASQATQAVSNWTQTGGPLMMDKGSGTEPAPAVNVELHLDENQLMPLSTKIMRVLISSISSAITAKTKRDSAPLKRALEGVANQVARTNIILANLSGGGPCQQPGGETGCNCACH